MIAGRTQKLAFDGVILSNSMGTETTRVRLISDQDCYVQIGANPEASNDGKSFRLEQDKSEEFDVSPGDKVSVIKVSTAGDLHITENANYFDFQKGLVAQYDTSDSGNYTVDGLSRVITATDLSGNGNDLDNDSVTNGGPTMIGSEFGARPAMHFADTTPARLVSTSSMSEAVDPNNFTMIFVVKRTKSNAGPWATNKKASTEDYWCFPNHNAELAWNQPNWPTTEARMPFDTAMVYAITCDATTMKHYVGKTIGPITHNTGQLTHGYSDTLDKLMLGKSPNQGSSHFKLGFFSIHNYALIQEEILAAVDHVNIDLGWNVPELEKTYNIIADGNSLTAAWGVGEDNWVVKTCKNLSISQHDVTISAIGGETLSQLIARGSSYYEDRYRSDLAKNIIIVWEITNEADHGPAGTTWADIKSRSITLGLMLKDIGYTVVWPDCLPRTGVSAMSDGAFETGRLDYNDFLDAEKISPTGGVPWFDEIVHVGAASGIGSVSDVSGSNYDGSGVHLSLAGHNIVANTIGPILSGLL